MAQSAVLPEAQTRLIVIGASAGGLTPLRTIAAALPADLQATVLIVMHISSTATSVLPEILARTTPMGVVPAVDGMELRPGRLVVAPPDRHMRVMDGQVELDRGPRENGHRPAVDPLFRSAAESYGPGVCGVILSGSRDDGTLGLAQIKAHGGAAIVQDPAEAMYDGMPANALAGADVDLVLRADEIGPALVRLAREDRHGAAGRAPDPGGPGEAADPEILTVLCPDCGGTLFQSEVAGVPGFHCRVGHRYSTRSLLAAHAEGVERAMWTAARSLEDRATLLRRMARRLYEAGAAFTAKRLEAQAASADEQVEAIRRAIAALDDAAIELPADVQEAEA